MSIQLIQKYYTEIDRIIRYGASRNESSLRKPFQDLSEGYARAKNLVLVAEVEMESKRGKRLMELHLNYESAAPFKLECMEPHSALSSTSPKSDGTSVGFGGGRVGAVTRLMARKERGEIEIDSMTTLRGIPAEAWDYRLGTYSALEWILERYKEKKPKSATRRLIENKILHCGFGGGRRGLETMKIVKDMSA